MQSNNRLLSTEAIYIGPVCIPDVTKVTLPSVRLWQTVTGLMTISYRAPSAVVYTPPVYYYYYSYVNLMAFSPGQPGKASTRKVNHSGFYWSRR